MDTSKPLLSGLAATILGTVGTLAAAVSPVVPAPWSALVGIVGFLLAALAGLSVPAPKVTEGRPVLQAGALAVATGALSVLVQFYPVVPAGWPQSVALGVGALLSWLTGKALPALESKPPVVAPPGPVEPVADLEEARRLLGGR